MCHFIFPEGQIFWAFSFFILESISWFSWGWECLSVSCFLFARSWGWEFLSVSCSILRTVHLDFPECESFWVFHVFIWTFHCSDGESYIKFFSCFEISIYFFSSSQLSFFLRRRILDLSANRNFTAMSAEAEAMAKAEQMAADVYFLDKKNVAHVFSRFLHVFRSILISISQGH